MQKEIIRLYPRHRKLARVRGLYTRKKLHRQGLVVYADFLASLDGRIAVKQNGLDTLPAQLASPDDHRLLMELQAQADCIVTHGGYLRARAAGRLGDVLRVGAGGHADLVAWRRRQGLAEQPLVLVCSASLDFPLPADIPPGRIRVMTVAGADARRAAELKRQGCRVTIAGKGDMVKGDALMKRLRAEKVNGVFLLAGPAIFESLVAAQGVRHLFLTVSHQLLGTPDFQTFMPGIASRAPSCRLAQKDLLYVRDGKRAQWFAHFECAY